MMINPSIEQLTKGKNMNRYMLVIAVAKAATLITQDYIKQKENADRRIQNKEVDGPASAIIDKVLTEQKAVETAVLRIKSGGYYRIYDKEDGNRID